MYTHRTRAHAGALEPAVESEVGALEPAIGGRSPSSPTLIPYDHYIIYMILIHIYIYIYILVYTYIYIYIYIYMHT